VISEVLAVVAVVVAGASILIAMGGRRPEDERIGGKGHTGPPGVDPRTLRDVAVIRYDALQEMSGQLSFSLALLNAQGDGVVLSSINGRAEARTYAKAVVAGKGGSFDLSPEEEEAIRVARLGHGPDAPTQVAEKPKITNQTGARGPTAVSQPG
jgi:hypothetical protein